MECVTKSDRCYRQVAVIRPPSSVTAVSSSGDSCGCSTARPENSIHGPTAATGRHIPPRNQFTISMAAAGSPKRAAPTDNVPAGSTLQVNDPSSASCGASSRTDRSRPSEADAVEVPAEPWARAAPGRAHDCRFHGRWVGRRLRLSGRRDTGFRRGSGRRISTGFTGCGGVTGAARDQRETGGHGQPRGSPGAKVTHTW
jgi:hypothetical protein